MRIDATLSSAEAARWWKKEADKEWRGKRNKSELGGSAKNLPMVVSDPVRRHASVQKEWYCQGHWIGAGVL
jgi:hypothetical protein